MSSCSTSGIWSGCSESTWTTTTIRRALIRSGPRRRNAVPFDDGRRGRTHLHTRGRWSPSPVLPGRRVARRELLLSQPSRVGGGPAHRGRAVPPLRSGGFHQPYSTPAARALMDPHHRSRRQDGVSGEDSSRGRFTRGPGDGRRVSRGLGSAQRRYHQHLADYLDAPNPVPSPVDNRMGARRTAAAAGSYQGDRKVLRDQHSLPRARQTSPGRGVEATGLCHIRQSRSLPVTRSCPTQ